MCLYKFTYRYHKLVLSRPDPWCFGAWGGSGGYNTPVWHLGFVVRVSEVEEIILIMQLRWTVTQIVVLLMLLEKSNLNNVIIASATLWWLVFHSHSPLHGILSSPSYFHFYFPLISMINNLPGIIYPSWGPIISFRIVWWYRTFTLML